MERALAGRFCFAVRQVALGVFASRPRLPLGSASPQEHEFAYYALRLGCPVLCFNIASNNTNADDVSGVTKTRPCSWR